MVKPISLRLRNAEILARPRRRAKTRPHCGRHAAGARHRRAREGAKEVEGCRWTKTACCCRAADKRDGLAGLLPACAISAMISANDRAPPPQPCPPVRYSGAV